MYAETRPFFEKYGYRDVVPFQYFDTNALAAAAIPATEFFNAAPPAYAVSNLEQANELPYPAIILAIGLQTFGPAATVLDQLLVFQHCEIEFEKDNRKWPSFPVCAVPGGGGLNVAIKSLEPAGPDQSATQGLGNSFRRLHSPIAVEPDQVIRAWLYSDGTALNQIVRTRIILEGFEARRII